MYCAFLFRVESCTLKEIAIEFHFTVWQRSHFLFPRDGYAFGFRLVILLIAGLFVYGVLKEFVESGDFWKILSGLTRDPALTVLAARVIPFLESLTEPAWLFTLGA